MEWFNWFDLLFLGIVIGSLILFFGLLSWIAKLKIKLNRSIRVAEDAIRFQKVPRYLGMPTFDVTNEEFVAKAKSYAEEPELIFILMGMREEYIMKLRHPNAERDVLVSKIVAIDELHKRLCEWEGVHEKIMREASNAVESQV